MKRLFILAAAAFAVVSCAEVGLDEMVSPIEDVTSAVTEVDGDGTKYHLTLSVSANEASDTRIAVDEAWAATWEDGDAIGAWMISDDSREKFVMTSYDPEDSVFEGEATGSFRLVYPYETTATVSGAKYTIDLRAQTAGLSSTYMVSSSVNDIVADDTESDDDSATEDDSTDDTDDDVETKDDEEEDQDFEISVAMAHVTAAAEFVASFSNVEEGYTLTSVEISGIPAIVDIDLTAAATSDSFYGEPTVGSIIVAVNQPVTESLSFRFNMVPFELEADASIGVRYYFEDEAGNPYYSDATITNSTGAAAPFARATYNKINGSCDMSAIAAAVSTIILSDLSATSIPEFDSWIITDPMATADSFLGYRAAIAALEGSGRLIDITFSNLGSIPDYASYGGESTYDSSLTNSVVRSIYGPYVMSIGTRAISNYKALTTINFPMATTVGEYAFYYDQAMESASMPKLTTIGARAFYYDYALATIDMPAVQSVGEYCFASCYALTELNFPLLTYVADRAFYSCSSVTSVYAPILTEVASYVFSGLDSLESLELPAVTTAAARAFSSNDSLVSLSLPELVTVTGTYPFYDNESLLSVNLPKLTNLTDYAFRNCDAIETISLPNVTSITNSVFRDCVALESVSMPQLVENGTYSFYGCEALTTVDLPLLETAGNYMFRDCIALESITLPSVTTTGTYMFQDCDLLTTVELPVLSVVSNYTFRSATALTKVSLATAEGAMLTSLGNSTFYGVETSTQTDLYLGELNASYVTDNVLKIGSYYVTFKSITVGEEEEEGVEDFEEGGSIGN